MKKRKKIFFFLKALRGFTFLKFFCQLYANCAGNILIVQYTNTTLWLEYIVLNMLLLQMDPEVLVLPYPYAFPKKRFE